MFNLGDKVVPNGFNADGVELTGSKKTWQEESTVLVVVRVDVLDDKDSIRVSDGVYINVYHPSELRVATKEEIKASDDKGSNKFIFDFDNYYYALKLNDDDDDDDDEYDDCNGVFIAVYSNWRGDIIGVCNNDKAGQIHRRRIEKIIAIIPKK